MDPKYVIALEIGSSKIRAALGTIDNNGTISIKAVEEEPLIDSVCYGRVRNVMQVTEKIRNIISRLQNREPSRNITGVYLALGGRSMRSSTINVQHILPYESEILQSHIDDLTRRAAKTNLPDRDVISVLPREYNIDRQKTNIPVVTFGREIDADYTLVSANTNLKKMLKHVFEGLSFKVHSYIVRPLAEADLVLSSDEKRAGCMLVDFGAETTTAAIYKDGNLVYLNTLPLGSRNITRDIMSVCHLEERAEERKISIGNANVRNSVLAPDANVDKETTEINNRIGARTGEIIANILEQINYAGLTQADLPSGIVVVGGGARLQGFIERINAATQLPVRLGLPAGDQIRITDNRIRPSEAIDVISVLVAAAPNAISCMEMLEQKPLDFEKEMPAAPEPVEEEPVEEGIDEAVTIPTISNFKIKFNNLRSRIVRLISENEEDEEDDNI